VNTYKHTASTEVVGDDTDDKSINISIRKEKNERAKERERERKFVILVR
jgi:hypothetical protein